MRSIGWLAAIAAFAAVPLLVGAGTESRDLGWQLEAGVLSTVQRVGIGTRSPQSALAVNGAITAQELNVTLEGWPDFVFHETYPLMDLEEVADRVRAEGRLPGFPSAPEVHEKGVRLGETTRLLVQKTEELTLYLIQLKRENARLAEHIRALEAHAGPGR